MNKNTIKITFISFLLIFMFSMKGYSQSSNDFVFIENSVGDIKGLQESYSNNSQVYFNTNPKPALYVYGQILNDRTVNNLFIYVPTEPGLLMFGSGDVSAATIYTNTDFLSGLTANVNGSIIVRSEDVFNGSKGELLKEKLELLTGLPVIMENNPQPFSN